MLYANVLTESYTTGEYTAVSTDLGAIVRPMPNDVARTTSVAPLQKGWKHHPQSVWCVYTPSRRGPEQAPEAQSGNFIL